MEDLFAEHFGEPVGELGVLAAEPLVVFAEVGQVGQQGLLAGAGADDGGGLGSAAAAWIWARRSW